MSDQLTPRAQEPSTRPVLAAALGLVAALASFDASAAPQSRLLRVDPRASMSDGAPVLTTVVELVQTKPYSQVTSACAEITGDGNLDCISEALLKPEALYTPLKWMDENAYFTVTVDGRDMPTTFVSRAKWGESKAQEGIGTAWLLMVDAGNSMGGRFRDAKEVARAFVNSMTPNDVVNIMFFNDNSVVRPSGWLTKKAAAVAHIDGVERTYPDQGRTRQLMSIIKTGATDAFTELGNAGGVLGPMHQAMVILSNGSGGSDSSSAAPSATVLKNYLTGGRFPEDNKTLPKAPVPIVSVWFPYTETEELRANARQFMVELANPEIGGFYNIVREGQAATKANRIVDSVRRRFDQMHVVKWRVPCVAPTVQQTFKLVWKSTDPPIAGDNFIDVPVGIDPTVWPLDVEVEKTQQAATKDKVHPGGKVRVFGNFCWGTDKQRAKLYLVPADQELPETLKGKGVDDARKAQQELVALKLVGNSSDADETYAEFEVPDNEKFLQLIDKKKKSYSARLVVYDAKLGRTSAVTSDRVLTLAAQKKPVNYLLIGAGTFGGVVLVLLLINVLKGGGRGGRRGGGGAPRPMMPGPGVGPGMGPMGPGMGPMGPPGPGQGYPPRR
ncbi:MAG: VWA domain-containing protein [Deltaproteobacteria bacterium]|nr:VWA domain-containing protein [Deltaproteobacteria bacterium]